jgi:ATP-dependent DNA helicase RecG
MPVLMVLPATDLPSVITEEEFWTRIGRRESTILDFKERLPKPGRLQEPVVAFANNRGGSIVLGVSERSPYEVVGAPWTQKDEELLQSMARSIQPPLAPEVSSVWVDGIQLVIMTVAPLERGWAQTSDGRLLVRSGPTNRALVGDELLRFVRERSGEPVEDEPVAGGVADLDRELVGAYLEARLGTVPRKRAPALRDLGFVTPTGELRLATSMLFAPSPQRDSRRFGIEILRFEGAIGGDGPLRAKQDLTGPLPSLVEQADRAIYDEMRREAVVRGLVREELPEFPPIVIREALLNAVGHRDYSARGAAVQVRVYDDALEIESPGTLPSYVTVENLRTEQYSRNPRIMDGLQRMGLVEEAGQGIDRMFEAMEAALLDPPEFAERSATFLVRLRGASVFSAEDRLWIGEFSELGLGADEKVALVYARRNGAITNEKLRALRKLDRDASRHLLQGLVARGLLEPLGRGRGARYVLGTIASRADGAATLGHRREIVLKHARRQGVVVNADVRGLLDLDSGEARELLVDLVARGLLVAEGERRGRRYLPR